MLNSRYSSAKIGRRTAVFQGDPARSTELGQDVDVCPRGGRFIR